jgi:hypothetical protein
MRSELPVLTVRYPTGETEYRTSYTTPTVGDVLSRNGDSWIVEEVTTSAAGIVVRLAPGLTPAVPEDEPA